MKQHFISERFDNHHLKSRNVAHIGNKSFDVFFKRYQKVSTDMESRKARVMSHERVAQRGFQLSFSSTAESREIPCQARNDGYLGPGKALIFSEKTTKDNNR